jgi:hypothetical protein
VASREKHIDEAEAFLEFAKDYNTDVETATWQIAMAQAHALIALAKGPERLYVGGPR